MKINLYEFGSAIKTNLSNLGRWDFFQAMIVKNIHKTIFFTKGTKFYTTSPFKIINWQKKNIEIVIKKGSIFSNGHSLNSSDVIWSINRALNNNETLGAIRLKKFDLVISQIEFDKFRISVNSNLLSAIDELSNIAYSIFIDNSLTAIDKLPLTTPSLGNFYLARYNKEKVIIKNSQKRYPFIEQINLNLRKNLLTNQTINNQIIRTTFSDYIYQNLPNSFFIDTGCLYRYLTINPKTKKLYLAQQVLKKLNELLDRQKLTELMKIKLGITVNPNSSLFFLDKYNKPQKCISPKQNLLVKLFCGNIDIIAQNLVQMLNLYCEIYNLKVNFINSINLDEADLVFIGHSYNVLFPLKSLKFFFFDALFLQLEKHNQKQWKDFFIHLNCSAQLGTDEFMFIEQSFFTKNNLSPLITPLFIDKLGYVHGSHDLFIKTKGSGIGNLPDWSII